MLQIRYNWKEAVKDYLRDMPGHVRFVCISGGDECLTCRYVQRTVDRLSDLSTKIEFVHSTLLENTLAQKYHVTRVPAMIVDGLAGDRIRYFGLPSGLLFASFIGSLVDSTPPQQPLQQDILDLLENIQKPITLEILIPPTSLFYPKCGREANRIAFACPFVTSETIETIEFPSLAMQYSLRQEPKVIINQRTELPETTQHADIARELVRAA